MSFSGNTRNYSQKTNIMAGSDTLDIFPFYLQAINIPGINFSHPEIGGRSGTKIILNADNVQFGDLSFSALVDQDFLLYDELMSITKEQLNYLTGQFKQKTFEFWISVTDGNGNDVIKWTFNNVKIESIGDLQYDYSSDETNFLIDVSMKFDTFTYKNFKKPQTIPTLKV
jgi:hypothetical protein